MAFKEITDLSADTTISLGGRNKKTNKDNPTKVEGYYLGNRQVPDNKKKSGFSFIYFFQTPKGNLGVWGKTDLDKKMSSATPGQMMKVELAGMVATPNGDMYKFKVAFDPENTIEVSAQAPPTQTAEESYDEGPSTEEEDEDDQDDFEQAEAAQTAALSALERKKKVEALLSGKAKKA